VSKLTILLAGLAALCSVPAVAQTTSVPVSFADLDLTSATGKIALEHRIDRAVTAICGIPDAIDLWAARATEKCRVETRAQARPRVVVAIAMAGAQHNIRTAAR
jgi:UrcA family protein